MILLGKAKSEQYLGFIPFFLNIELVLDFTIAQIKDWCSHLIILYLTIIALINSALVHFFTKYKFSLLETLILGTPKKNSLNKSQFITQQNLNQGKDLSITYKLYPNLAYSL